MSKVKLTDKQIEAVTHKKGNALVSASAGSGKTHVVIERIIKLILEEGVSVKNILAVTFTKASAEEMKEKLKKAITEKHLQTKDKRLKEELDIVSSSDISTIDAFCSKLVKKYFYLIGVDSSVQVLDDGKKTRLTVSALDETFESLYESGEDWFLSLIPVFSSKRSDAGLRESVLSLNKHCEMVGGADVLLERTKDSYKNVFDYLNKELREDLNELSRYYCDKFKNLSERFCLDVVRKENCKKFANAIELISSATDYFEFFKSFNFVEFKEAGKKSDEPLLLQELKDLLKEFNGKILKFKDIFSVDKQTERKSLDGSLAILENLFKVTAIFSENFNKIKKEENAVDFADIERYALQILKFEDVRREISKNYDYIFVDEYQDVNDVQEEIISLVTNDNSFLVGDSKQCIYAFRGCNPEYFREKYRLYEKGKGTAIPLDNNFRSAPNIVNGVNRIFERVMTESFGGNDYANNLMIYGEGYADYEGVCQIHVVNKTKKEKEEVPSRGVYSVLNSNEKLIDNDVSGQVKLILKIISDRLGKEYYDLKTKSYKTIGFGDICILLRGVETSKIGQEVVQTLVKAGVPVSSVVKKDVKNYPEIKVLLNLLALIVNAERDVPLATVMLKLFEFTEDELATIKKARAQYGLTFYDCVLNYSLGNSLLSAKCKKFLDWLDEKRLIAEFLTVDELFNGILKETGYLARVTASEYGPIRLRRIERFLSESVIGGKKMRAVEFEAHIEEVLDDIKLSEASGEDTVQVMTMHSSKGLEFPVVICAGLEKRFTIKDKSAVVMYHRNTGVAISSFDHDNMTVSSNLVRALIRERLERAERVEELRLFYVALTRAKCELYMLASNVTIAPEFNPSVVTSMSDYLHICGIPVTYHNECDIDLADFSSKETVVAGKETQKLLTEKIIENLSFVYPYIGEVELPVKTSVSDVNKGEDNEYFMRTDKFGSSSSEKGTAYHRFFELIDFYSFNGEADLKKFVEDKLMDKAQAEFIDVNKVERILSLPVFEKIKGAKLLKEQKFCHLVSANKLYDTPSTEKVLIQGIADLIAIGENGATLIDYKISTIERDEDIVKAYKTQMELYKNAIESVLKIKVNEVLIINVLQEKVIKVV